MSQTAVEVRSREDHVPVDDDRPAAAGRLRGLPAAAAHARAAQLLDVLDLTADARRLVADYSTGMRKKTMLSCALIHNPSVLFLDEPLEGVDPISADVIRRLLTRFTGSGSTVLFSSHVMELAGLGAALALSNIFTVVLPYPVEQRAGSPTPGAAQGYGAHPLLGVLGNLGGVGIAEAARAVPDRHPHQAVTIRPSISAW